MASRQQLSNTRLPQNQNKNIKQRSAGNANNYITAPRRSKGDFLSARGSGTTRESELRLNGKGTRPGGSGTDRVKRKLNDKDGSESLDYRNTDSDEDSLTSRPPDYYDEEVRILNPVTAAAVSILVGAIPCGFLGISFIRQSRQYRAQHLKNDYLSLSTSTVALCCLGIGCVLVVLCVIVFRVTRGWPYGTPWTRAVVRDYSQEQPKTKEYNFDHVLDFHLVNMG